MVLILLIQEKELYFDNKDRVLSLLQESRERSIKTVYYACISLLKYIKNLQKKVYLEV